MTVNLNPSQQDALDHIQGPTLILAGAGTGKTRVLTHRIAKILQEKRCFFHEILAVTFTNKAAEEIKTRALQLQNHSILDIPWIGTFHKMSLKIMRSHPEHMQKMGFGASFPIIFDQDDSERLLKTILKETKQEENFPIKYIQGALENFKNKGIFPEKIVTNTKYPQAVLDIYKIYQQRLLTLNALDFGDILLYGIRLLEDFPEVLSFYREHFKYILVDEYQDTNTIQYRWLKLLTNDKQNICCVGDEDQSIYGWRGARIDNILRFEKDFPQAKVIRLEQNYRSTKHILHAASTLISHNKERLGKTLWTQDQEGEPIHLIGEWDQTTEASHIARVILNNKAQEAKTLHNTAVLVRMSAQTREIEECFIKNHIPYHIIGSARFYDRMEIRDFIAYLRLVAHPSHDLAFLRIINKPTRGIGKKTIDTIVELARIKNCSYMDAAHLLLEDPLLRRAHNIPERMLLKGASLRALLETMNMIDSWIMKTNQLTPLQLAENILKESGYLNLYQSGTSEDQSRLENLNELLNVIQDFQTLEEFLEHSTLSTDTVMESLQDDQAQGRGIALMTMHAAKGLEFDTVFLPGWEEGIFPSARAIEDSTPRNLEEERRLAYVSITRAKKQLYILFTANRMWHGKWQQSLPSRFINELPKDTLHTENCTIHQADTYTSSSPLHAGPSSHSSRSGIGNQEGTKKRGGIEKGDRCFHQKFGYGIVLNKEGDRILIDFETSGQKTILSSFLQKSSP